MNTCIGCCNITAPIVPPNTMRNAAICSSTLDRPAFQQLPAEDAGNGNDQSEQAEFVHKPRLRS